jgi:selenocysteine lyase/cysteine desulfurase
VDPFLPDDQKVAAIRELLPATGAGIYLDTATAGPFPAETDRALREADEWELRVGRVAVDRSEETTQRAAEARAVVAATLGVSPDGVVLTTGSRSAVAALLAARPPMPGDRVTIVATLLPELDAAVRSIAARTNGHVRRIDPSDPMPGPGLTFIPTVDATTGAVLPVADLVRRAHGARSLAIVDASLTAGAVPLAHAELGADALLLDGHRWLLGPEGVTAVWVDPGLDPAAAADAADPPPRRVLLGLARSVSWLLMYVGLPWAQVRTRDLARRLAERLASIERVELGDAPDQLGALVPFRIEGWPVDEVADQLGRRVFAIIGRDPIERWLRASVGAWNQEDELDRFADACAELARHTPATLPRGPSMVITGQSR